ncbi:MAG: hypothetical protein MUC90_03785 [Thermoplasmata archaeon]|jgi:hypothetical protein|nr:hypothetical protein [Thermoplasmata archaeon]
MNESGIGPEAIKMKVKMDYARLQKDPGIRALDSILELMAHLKKPSVDVRYLIDDALKLMYRQLHIKEITVGLRDPSDGLFRYVAQQGVRDEIWEGHRQLTYKADAFTGRGKWKGTVISKNSILYLVEDQPYADGEKNTYQEHLSQVSKRRTMEDSIEGDYLDVHITGANGEILGWFEASSMWDGKLPSANTIRWMELIADIVAIALSRERENGLQNPAARTASKADSVPSKKQ